MNRQSRSESKRRGLTLSLSRQKRSQPRENPQLNITQPISTISTRRAPNVTFSHCQTQRAPSPGAHTFKIVPQQPKIIYRMKKSQWEILQESNRQKKQVVHQFKNQAKHLGQQINSMQQRAQTKRPISSYRTQNIQHTQRSFTNPLPVYPQQQYLGQPLQIIPESPQKEDPHTTKFTININCSKQNMSTQLHSKELTKQKQKKTLIQPPLTTPYRQLSTNKLQQTVEPFQQSKRRSIDLGALSEIENRLNDLIRFTES